MILGWSPKARLRTRSPLHTTKFRSDGVEVIYLALNSLQIPERATSQIRLGSSTARGRVIESLRERTICGGSESVYPVNVFKFRAQTQLVCSIR